MAIRYNPTTTNQAGVILGNSIAGAFDSIGDGMKRAKEEERRKKEEDKQKQEEREQYQTIAEAMGLPPGQASAMSLGELKGFAQSAAVRETNKLRAGMQEAMNEYRMAKGHGAKDVTMAQIMMDKGILEPQLLQIGAQIDEAMRGGKEMKWNLQPGESVDLGGGKRGTATSPNSIQVMDDTTKPLGDATVLGYIPDQNGNPSGAAIVDMGDGKRRVVNTQSGQEFNPLIQAILLQNADRKYPGLIEKVLGGNGGEPETDTAAPSRPATNPPVIRTGPSTRPATTVDGGGAFNDEFFSRNTL